MMMGRVIGGFLILGVVYVVIMILYGYLDSFVTNVGEFLFNSFWGIVALCLGIGALILFYASAKTSKHVLKAGKEIKKVKPILIKMENSLTQSNDSSVIDMTSVDLQGVFRSLVATLNSPTPVIFKGWGNKRLELDVDRVRIITSYIQAVQDAGEAFMDLKADAILSFEKLKALTEIKKNDLKREVRESELKLDLLNAEYENKIRDIKVQVDLKEADLNLKKIEIEEREAQIKERERELFMKERMNEAKIKVMTIKTKDESLYARARADLLDRIIQEMDFNNISPSQAFVLINALSPGTLDDTNFQTKSEMVQQELEKMKAEARYKNAEAKEREATADEKKAQSDFNIFDLENENPNIKNTNKKK